MTRALSVLLLVIGPRVVHAQAACPAPTRAAALEQTLARAETAFSELQVETFLEAMDEASYAVPCLVDVLDVGAVARIHRLQGLRQFVASEEARAVQAFAAARAADSTYILPSWLVPEGHMIRDLYGQFPLDNAAAERVPRPRDGAVRFDGVEGLDRPTRWPTLVQVQDANGVPVASAYLFPGDAMPAYPMLAAEPQDARARTGGEAPQRRARLALAGGSLAAGIAAGALYGLAAGSASDFDADHPEWDRADLVASRARTNSLVVASGSSAALAVGAGVAALVLLQW